MLAKKTVGLAKLKDLKQGETFSLAMSKCKIINLPAPELTIYLGDQRSVVFKQTRCNVLISELYRCQKRCFFWTWPTRFFQM